MLLENDIPLKVQKPKSTTINFNEDSDSDPEDEPEPEEPKKAAKVWGTSTRNKKSIKKEQHVIKVVDAYKYDEPAYF